MRISTLWSLVICVLFVAAGCGDSTSNPADAATDNTADSAADVLADGAADVATDTVADAATDNAADVAADTARDAATDVTADIPVDAARDAATDASTTCGTATCAASEICLRQRTVGGVFLPPDDAGVCPAGRHVEGASCVADFSYRCVARPTCAMAACACLGALCPSSFTCTGAEASLLTCEQMAP